MNTKKLFMLFAAFLFCLTGMAQTLSTTKWVIDESTPLTVITPGQDVVIREGIDGNGYSSNGFLNCGKYDVSAFITAECVYRFEVVGEVVQSDGTFTTYALKNVSNGKYLSNGSEKYVSSVADAFVFTAKVSVEAETLSDRSYEINGNLCAGAGGKTFVFSNEEKTTNISCVGNPNFDHYWDTSNWYVFATAEELATGRDQLEEVLMRYIKNEVNETNYPVGTGICYLTQEVYDALKAAYDAAKVLYDDASSDDAACATAAEALLNAWKQFKTTQVIPEGYYQIVGTNNRGIYGASGGVYYNENTGDAITTPTADNVDYIWKFVSAGTDDEGTEWYYIQNIFTETYVGTHPNNSSMIPMTETAEEKYRVQLTSAPGYGGQYDIINETRGNGVSFNCDPRGSVVFWTTASGANAAFQLIPLAEDLVTAATEIAAQKKADLENKARMIELRSLLDEAYALRESGKVYTHSAMMTQDADYTNGGIFTYNATTPNASTNAQEVSEGPLEALFDGNVDTYFHTAWQGDMAGDMAVDAELHYLQLELDAAIQTVTLKYTQRKNQGGWPLKWRVLASNDGTNWTEQGVYDLPYQIPSEVQEEDKGNDTGWLTFKMDNAYQYIRLASMDNGQGKLFWHMAELRVYDGGAYDTDNSLYELVHILTRRNMEYFMQLGRDELAAGAASQDIIDALKEATEDLENAYKLLLRDVYVQAQSAYLKSRTYTAAEGLPLDHDYATNPGVTINNVSTNALETREGSLEGLTDGDFTTYFHTDWSDKMLNSYDFHYVQLDLDQALQDVTFKYTQRRHADGWPLVWQVSASNDGTTWTDQGYVYLNYQLGKPDGYTGIGGKTGYASIQMDAAYSHIRLAAAEVEYSPYNFTHRAWHMAELHVYDGAGSYDAANSPYEQVYAVFRSDLENAIAAAVPELSLDVPSRATVEALQVALRNFSADQSEAADALAESNSWYTMTDGMEGDALGYFQPGARAEFKAAIDEISPRVTGMNTYDEIQSIKSDVAAAIDAFNEKLNKPTDGGLYYIVSRSMSYENGNNAVYATNDATAALKRGLYNSDSSNDYENFPNAIWKTIKNADGSYTLQNVGTGTYMKNVQTCDFHNPIILTETPDAVSLRSARSAGCFNIVMAENVFVNTCGCGCGNLVTWDAAEGADNSAFAFVPVETTLTAEGKLELKHVALPAADITAETYAAMLQNVVTDGVLSVDLSAGTLDAAVTAEELKSGLNTNPNVLFYLPTGSTLSADNFVVDAVAENIVLTDGYDFECPEAFTATNISYTRTPQRWAAGKAGWESIVLPFAANQFTASTKGALTPIKTTGTGHFWLRAYTESSGEGYVNFASTTDGVLQANTPYIVAFPGEAFGSDNSLEGQTITFSAENATVDATPAEIKTEQGGYCLNGTLLGGVNVGDGYTLAANGGTFEHSAALTPAAFRAYFTSVSGGYGTKQLRFGTGVANGIESLTSNTENGVSVEADGTIVVTTSQSENISVYGVDGRVVRNTTLNVGENRIEGLPAGVYVVNKQKVTVR